MKPRILVIDDEEGVRKSLRMILEYDGYDVTEAATGEEGVKLIERQHRTSLEPFFTNSPVALIVRGSAPIRVRLTEKGRNIRTIIAQLFQRHASGILSREVLGNMRLEDINASLRRMERYWSDQIRYIY